jgi:hypothetical protein
MSSQHLISISGLGKITDIASITSIMNNSIDAIKLDINFISGLVCSTITY